MICPPFFKDFFFFLVCNIFKVFVEFVATVFLFQVLVLWPRCMCDLSSLLLLLLLSHFSCVQLCAAAQMAAHQALSPGKNTGVGCHFLLQCVEVKSLSRVRLLETPWTAAYQVPPSMGFSRQEYWNGLSLPSPLSSLTRDQMLTPALALLDCLKSPEMIYSPSHRSDACQVLKLSLAWRMLNKQTGKLPLMAFGIPSTSLTSPLASFTFCLHLLRQ